MMYTTKLMKSRDLTHYLSWLVSKWGTLTGKLSK